MSIDIETTLKTLQDLVADSTKLTALPEDQRVALMAAAGRLSRPDRAEQKRRNREKNRLLHTTCSQLDRAARAETGIRRAREVAVFTAPKQIAASIEAQTASSDSKADTARENAKPQPELQSPRNCYVCKAEFT